jgi:hypothetical protein
MLPGQDTRSTPRTENENQPTNLKCPVMGEAAAPYRHTAAGAMSIGDWWPNQLNLDILHQNSAKSNPMGEDFDSGGNGVGSHLCRFAASCDRSPVGTEALWAAKERKERKGQAFFFWKLAAWEPITMVLMDFQSGRIRHDSGWKPSRGCTRNSLLP